MAPHRYTALNGEMVNDRRAAQWGRQILDVLLYCRSLDLPPLCIHTGNVAIIDGVAQVVELETALLGLQPLVGPQTPAGRAMDADVFAFGRLMYEMAVGYSMDGDEPDLLPDNCSRTLREVVEYIFKKRPTKKLSLRKLSAHPFFATFPRVKGTKPKLAPKLQRFFSPKDKADAETSSTA